MSAFEGTLSTSKFQVQVAANENVNKIAVIGAGALAVGFYDRSIIIRHLNRRKTCTVRDDVQANLYLPDQDKRNPGQLQVEDAPRVAVYLLCVGIVMPWTATSGDRWSLTQINSQIPNPDVLYARHVQIPC